MKFRYYLKDKNKPTSQIYIDIRQPEERLRIPIGYQVKSKNWDSKKQLVKNTDKNFYLINSKLKNLSELIEQYIIETEYVNRKASDVENLVKNYSNSKDSKSDLIQDFIPKYIQKYNNIKTANRYKVLGSILNAFNSELKFRDLSVERFEEFNKFLIFRNYSNSYIVRCVKQLKTLVRGYAKTNPKYNISFLSNYKNEVKNYNTTLIALDEYEISLLKEAELKDSYQKIRDLFLIQCYTGLRVLDLLNIKAENIDKKKKELLLTTIKTSEIIRIPITSTILPIFEKYSYILPKISDIKYNKYIKNVCRISGIDSPTLITSWKGGQRIDEIKPKYELISSHTARRTFITRLLKKGLLPEQIMKITGHRNRRSFDEYVKITQSDAIDSVRNALE